MKTIKASEKIEEMNGIKNNNFSSICIKILKSVLKHLLKRVFPT